MDKTTQKTMFSSKSMEWATPQHFFDQLDEKFGPFTLDPCSNESNYKVKNRFTEKDDGLSRDWSKNVVFMNPPYGRGIKHWIKKAYEEGQKDDPKGAKKISKIPQKWFCGSCYFESQAEAFVCG